jgi:two-component system response regulator
MEKNQTKRVALIVEGVGGLAQVILDAFMRDEQPVCEVIVKHDGMIEALDYLLYRRVYAGRDPNVRPCVALIDLALHDSDGLELLRAMRHHEQTRLMPLVAFSSAGEQEQRHQQADVAYALGVNSYIDIRPGFGPFEESLQRMARYWCVVNDPPPSL